MTQPNSSGGPSGSEARGSVYRLTYSNARADYEPKIFMGRDAMAFLELLAAIQARLEMSFNTSIFLYPDDERPLSQFPTLNKQDLLVLTTRPPLDDMLSLVPPRKTIRGTRTELETACFRVLGKYFQHCTRKQVHLTNLGAKHLTVDDHQKWQWVEFYEYGGARIQRYHVGSEAIKVNGKTHSTVGYFLRVNEVPGLGCGLVASFGMDGLSTLIWNRIVRTRFPHWLDTEQFRMAEIQYLRELPPRPLTPAFADDPKLIHVRVLTETGRPAPANASTRVQG